MHLGDMSNSELGVVRYKEARTEGRLELHLGFEVSDSGIRVGRPFYLAISRFRI